MTGYINLSWFRLFIYLFFRSNHARYSCRTLGNEINKPGRSGDIIDKVKKMQFQKRWSADVLSITTNTRSSRWLWESYWYLTVGPGAFVILRVDFFVLSCSFGEPEFEPIVANLDWKQICDVIVHFTVIQTFTQNSHTSCCLFLFLMVRLSRNLSVRSILYSH